ncbi:MAG: 2,3-bisphosphoglycerate-independent phosphoglycerate mutase [Candidatus Omnitrophica bacterium]|nr:2,3-bisphosphoglycerate-independent phosphoglycerate mutase [Candidatus Omnitrophota bacterium]
MKRNIVLIIRDGWGINSNPEYNAVANANTPYVDLFLKKYPNAVLGAAGVSVGLPEGYQGSSEVGHLNIGAGRIVKQELTRVNDAIKDRSFFRNPNFQKAINNCKVNNSSLHIIGLVQDEGVHAHQDHLFAIMKYAKQQSVKKLYIHFFSDGRDTPPRSALGFLRVLEEKIKEYQIGEIGTLMGRYYAMDRGKNWHLTTQAYNALTKAEGIRIDSAEMAITRAYNDDRTPSGREMFDEYISPSVIGNFSGIKDGDSVIHFNYRQDRAIQLTKAFVENGYPGERWKKLSIVYCGLTRYYDTFRFNVLEAIDETREMRNLLGEIISRSALKQLRISETQKFRHVTSFFNGKIIDPFENEERIEIKSTYDPATFAEHPEMNAFDVAEAVIKEINRRRFAVIVLNFANCDMVGHTGDYEAAIKAVEVVDKCVGRVVNATLLQEGMALVTADHGNVEEMIDYKTGLLKTAHTRNPVEFIYVAKDYERIKLKPKGILSDIAPTILYLLGIEQPVEMIAENLIEING